MLALLKRLGHATWCIALLETAVSPVGCNFFKFVSKPYLTERALAVEKLAETWSNNLYHALQQ